jgi:manganese/zinc/iron transport system substrate-binding protein
MTKFLSALASACAALALVGCGAASEGGAGDGELDVIATTGMVADAATNVGGEHVRVTGLMGPGVDPHLYKASEGDVRRLEQANLVLYNGLHLEAKMADVLERIGENGDRPTRAVAEAVPEERLRRVSAAQFDPHVWFDVGLWAIVVGDVRDALQEADPDRAEEYAANAEAYLAELAALGDEVTAATARVPEGQRVLITAHDAFEYFGAAYGFEVRGLQGISTVTEAGARDVKELADFIVARKIPAIFVESSVSPRTIEAVQAAVRSRGFDVQIGGSLFSDAMGEPGTPEGTYLGMVRHNVDTIVAGLLGQQ